MSMTTELAQRMKAAAIRAKAATEDYVTHRISMSVCLSECEEFNNLSDGPDNIIALVEALEKAQAITAAAEKLVRCKGRYHSEQNYRARAALFGVKTPDLPPLESESRTVTVKLRDINEYLADVHDKTLALTFRRLAEGVRAGDIAAMTDAGIQVIEGEGQ